MKFAKYYDGKGYMFFCVRDTSVPNKKDKKYAIYEHRLLMYGWGELDSVFFSNDMGESHHNENPKDLNIRDNLQSLTPKEHRDLDSTRAQLVTPWDRLAGD